MALQAKWDKKLAAAGFKDIEGGQDTNLIPGSTFRGISDHADGRGSCGAEHVIGIPSAFVEDHENVFHSPRARAWALFSQAAYDLPRDARTRDILVEVAKDGDPQAVARRRRIPRDRVYSLVWRLCGAIGIESKNLFGGVTEAGDFDIHRTARMAG